jgi:hypothetical protein
MGKGCHGRELKGRLEGLCAWKMEGSCMCVESGGVLELGIGGCGEGGNKI